MRRLVPFWALGVALLFAPLVWSASFSWDDADPEVLNNAWRLATGLPLYHSLDGPPWVVNPYTPLYHVLSAAALRVTGLSFRPARAISLLSSAAVALALALLARRFGRRVREGVWSAALLLLVPAVLYNAARPHPQMLGVALSLWSFFFFESRSRVLAELLSPLLAVLAVYTKQTQIVLPLALGAYLLWRDRPRFLRYSTTVAFLGLAPVPWLERATNGQFLECVVGLNFLPFSFGQISGVLIHHAGPLFGFLGVAVARLAARVRGRTLSPVDFYFGLLVPVTVGTLGRAGAHGQYVLEMLVVGVVYLLATGGVRFPRGRRGLAAAQLGLLMAYAPAFVVLEEGLWDWQAARAAPAVRELLETRPGPILSEQGSFPLFTRGAIHIQLFHFAALARQGRWDQAPLLREVREHRLGWVVTEFPLEAERDDDALERFTDELFGALRQEYVRRAEIGPYFVYEPRAEGHSIVDPPPYPSPRRGREPLQH
jgi:Dolichyl-phosphate-mannose-protein mannosyltransferase